MVSKDRVRSSCCAERVQTLAPHHHQVWGELFRREEGASAPTLIFVLGLVMVASLCATSALFAGRIIGDKNYLEYRCRGDLLDNERKMGKFLEELLKYNKEAWNLISQKHIAEAMAASGWPPTAAAGQARLQQILFKQAYLKSKQYYYFVRMALADLYMSRGTYLAPDRNGQISVAERSHFDPMQDLIAEQPWEIATPYRVRNPRAVFVRKQTLTYSSSDWRMLYRTTQLPFVGIRLPTSCAVRLQGGPKWDAVLTTAR